MADAPSLAGRAVLVIRPSQQTGELVRLIETAGGQAIRFPTLEIELLPPTPGLSARLKRLPEFDLAVFVSANAVQAAWPLIEHVGGWPSRLRAAAVGAATGRALIERGVREVHIPANGADSDALLALPELQEVKDASIIIFRGEGGREQLAETLRARGAQVEYAECYRRVLPNADVEPLRERLAQGRVDAIAAGSTEALVNLLELVGTSDAVNVRTVPLFVPHERIAERARALGFAQCVVTATGDRGLLRGIIEFYSGRML